MTVAERAVNSSELHQQVWLEVGAARDIAAQQCRFTQAFFGDPVGRGQIPHFQIQAGQIDGNGSKVGMIAHHVGDIARPQEACKRGTILKREQLAATRAHEIANGG